MTKASALISTLRSCGARLQALDGGLLGVTPRSLLTEDLRRELRIHRDEILRNLRLENGQADSPAVRLDRAWAVAVERARAEFASRSVSTTPENITAAAKLELDLADFGPPFPVWTTAEFYQELLHAVYAGRLEARLLESGSVQLQRSSEAGRRSR